MTDLTEFLFPAPAPRNTVAVVRWWEGRRLGYNALVGTAGLFAYTFSHVWAALPPNPHPGVPLLVAVPFGIAANVCYCLGPLLEIGVQKFFGRAMLPIGPTLFRMGLTFSVGLAMLPALISPADFMVRVVRFVLGV
jgi:hypothetical protein